MTNPVARPLRCFIGVPVDHLLGIELLSLRDDMLRAVAGAQPRPVTAGNFHLTLAFIGATELAMVDTLAAMLDALALRHQPFTQPLDHAGLFPPPHGNCLAAQGSAVDDLGAVVSDLRQQLVTLGLKVERRPLLPHITLARLGLAPVPAPHCRIRLPCHVSSLVLFESVQRNGAPHYRRLRHADLLS